MNEPASDNSSYGDATSCAHDLHNNEMWISVADWPYEVSNFGRVRRVGRATGAPRGRTLKGTRGGGTKREYPVVLLKDRGRHRWVARHILVAEAFIGPRPIGKELHHKDHNPRNPAVSNLEYVTSSQNKHHAVTNGYHGTRRYNSKLNPDLVREIRRMRANGHKVSEISETIKVGESSIYHVLSGRNWRQVQD